jgi:hypothetical protein
MILSIGIFFKLIKLSYKLLTLFLNYRYALEQECKSIEDPPDQVEEQVVTSSSADLAESKLEIKDDITDIEVKKTIEITAKLEACSKTIIETESSEHYKKIETTIDKIQEINEDEDIMCLS